MSNVFSEVENHYSVVGLTEKIFAALRAAGRDPGALQAEDLARLDQFHTRGMEATEELAKLAGVRAEMRVLDAGSGIGGPARYLASAFGCRVTGLDLTAEFCEAAAALSRAAGFGDRVRFETGNALAMPFEPETFDLLWTQHASMNIAAKDRLYREFFRVLKPGGRLAVYDVAAGAAGQPYYPAPWAREAAISFLAPQSEMRAMLEAAGFSTLVWDDATAAASAWFRDRAARAASEPPPALGLHLIAGPDWSLMLANQARNLRENRVSVFNAVLEKPAPPQAAD